jgi:hypothetical protein
MPTTITKETKPTSLSSTTRRWDDATETWDDATYTWDDSTQFSVSGLTKESKPSNSITKESKP